MALKQPSASRHAHEPGHLGSSNDRRPSVASRPMRPPNPPQRPQGVLVAQSSTQNIPLSCIAVRVRVCHREHHSLAHCTGVVPLSLSVIKSETPTSNKACTPRTHSVTKLVFDLYELLMVDPSTSTGNDHKWFPGTEITQCSGRPVKLWGPGGRVSRPLAVVGSVGRL